MRDGDRADDRSRADDGDESRPDRASLRDRAGEAVGRLDDAAGRLGGALRGRASDDRDESDDGASGADGDDRGEDGLGPALSDRAADAGATVRDRLDGAGDATAAARASVEGRLGALSDDDGADGVEIEVTEGDGVAGDDERLPRRARDAPETDLREAEREGDGEILRASGGGDGDGDAPSPAFAAAPGAAVTRARTTVAGADRRLKRTVDRADPTETGKWALSGGLWLLAPALAVGYPTALVVGAGAVGGAVVGAYASGADETALDAVDPSELPRRAAEGAAYGRRYGQYGSAAGALLGGGLYVAHSLAPDALEAVAADVDGDAVLRGAAMGAERAAERGGDPLRAGLAGGGLGALSGYADGGAGVEADLADLLDEDLYREYESRLADRGGDGNANGNPLPPEGDGPIDVGDAETDGAAGAGTETGGDDGEGDTDGGGEAR